MGRGGNTDVGKKSSGFNSGYGDGNDRPSKNDNPTGVSDSKSSSDKGSSKGTKSSSGGRGTGTTKSDETI